QGLPGTIGARLHPVPGGPPPGPAPPDMPPPPDPAPPLPPVARAPSTPRLAGQTGIALVTGASRGAGRGIAIALGSHGGTVYVTGRSEKTGDANLPGTIYETAEAVTQAGGRGIAVRVDHGDDRQGKALFEQIEREQGRLDILVNNACALHDQLTSPGHFWEKPLQIVDMLEVGLRSGFVASYYGAPMMVRQRKGLILFTSASGAVHYVFGPVY